MMIALQQLKPTYMSESDVKGSDIFLQDHVPFGKGKKYFIKASSGKGKTSVLNFIYGCNLNYEGKIFYDNKINVKDLSELRLRRLSYVFQDFKLFPEISLYENIEIKNKLTGFKSGEEIREMIDKVQLHHKSNALVKTLSLGQRQRVAIIRALCQPFDFLLMDEPFSHLDDDNIAILTELIGSEVEKQKAGMILTSLGSEYNFTYDTIYQL
jgi:putative ABC transport system ATP-binding protein